MEVKIIPTGGLCNRLRAIATGVAVAKSYHCELFKPIPQEDVNW